MIDAQHMVLEVVENQLTNFAVCLAQQCQIHVVQFD